MAGRVLRKSNGRFAGSTKGWMKGVRRGDGGNTIAYRNADGSKTVYRTKLTKAQKKLIRNNTAISALMAGGTVVAATGVIGGRLNIGAGVAAGIHAGRKGNQAAKNIVVNQIKRRKNSQQTLTIVKTKKAPNLLKKVGAGAGYLAIAGGVNVATNKHLRAQVLGSGYKQMLNNRVRNQKIYNQRRLSDVRGLKAVPKASRRRANGTYKITTLKGRIR